MRILLLACPRSGSTSLLKSLSKSLNLNHISIDPESFKYSKNKKLISHILKKDNVIIRSSVIINHGMPIIEFISKFDYTILLSRENNEDHKISFSNLYYKKMYNENIVHDTYTLSEIPNYIFELEDFILKFNKILEEKKYIENISNLLKLPIIYYEYLYYSKEGTLMLKNFIPEINIFNLEKELLSTKKMRKCIETKLI
jgi:hypothetical protein